MKFTINCTRVPISQGTTLYGTPVDVGPAPAFPGVASNHAAPQGHPMMVVLSIFRDKYYLTEQSQLHVLPSQKTLLVVKTKLFLALLMLGPLPPKGA